MEGPTQESMDITSENTQTQSPNTGDLSPEEKRVNFSKMLWLSDEAKKIMVVNSAEEIIDHKDDSTSYCVLGGNDHILALKAKIKELSQRAQDAQREREQIEQKCENVDNQLGNLVGELKELEESSTITTTETVHASIKVFGEMKIETIEDEDHEHQYDRLFHKPRVRQWFIGDTLYREAEERKTSYTELFWDLIFVGCIGLIGHELVTNLSGLQLQKFAFCFIPIYRVWMEVHNYLNVFSSEDLIQKLFILWEMILVTVMGTSSIGITGDTRTLFTGSYLVARGTVACLYLIYGLWLSTFRIHLFSTTFGIVFTNLPWVASLWVSAGSNTQIILIWVAILLDGAWLFIYPLYGKLYQENNPLFIFPKSRCRPAVNIEHLTERLGLFVIITLGEVVVALLYNTVTSYLDQIDGKAVMGLLIAYCLHWIYFDVDASRTYQHAVRRHFLTGLLFSWIHLPLCMSIIVVGDSIKVLVQVRDFGEPLPEIATNLIIGADSGKIKRDSLDVIPATIPTGLDWLFCSALGIAIICLATIGTLHKSMDKVDLMWIYKRYRIGLRYLIAFIIIFLPFAHLNSINLLLVSCVLCISLVIIETYGRMSRNPRGQDCDDDTCDASTPRSWSIRISRTRSTDDYDGEFHIQKQRSKSPFGHWNTKHRKCRRDIIKCGKSGGAEICL